MDRSKTDTNVTPLRADGVDGAGYRVPPHNFEAEMALLGAILANNRAYERVSEFLRPEHFADVVYQTCALTKGGVVSEVLLYGLAQDVSGF